MERRTILVAVLLIATVAVTSLFWNFPSLAQVTQPSYAVKVRRQNIPPATVVFYHDDVIMADIIIREPYATWYNLTLLKGAYMVKVYAADTGLFLKEFEIYVAKNIELTV